MKRSTLSRKLLLAFFLILLPVFLISLATYFRTVDYLKKEILSELGMIAQGYEGQVYQFLEMAKRRVSDFSSDGFIKDGLSRVKAGSPRAGIELSAHLIKNKITLDKSIDTIHILSDEGKVIASTDGASIGKDFSGEAFFKSGGLSVTQSLKDNGASALIASNPVLNENGERAGVVANVILLSELNGLLTGAFQKELGAVSSFEARPGSMKVYLVDRRMRSISGSSLFVDQLRIDTLPVRGCVDGGKQTSAFYTNHVSLEVAGVAVCIPSMGWTLMVEINEAEALTPSRVILQGAFTSVIVAVILIAGLLMIFMRKVVRPLQTMSGAAKEIAGGNYDVRMRIESSDEIGTLASALSTMAKDIQAGTEALKESEKRLKRTQQIAKIGSWEWNPASGRVTCSEEALRLFGFAQGASLEDFLEKVHEKDRQAVSEGLRSAVPGKPFSLDLRADTAEGERIIHMQAECEGTGGSYKLSGAVQDITERKKLEESKEHLARIIDLTTDLVSTADASGNILYFNKGGRKMLGLGDAVDRDVRISDVHPDWAAKIILEEGFPSAKREGAWSGETAFLARDGQSIPASQVIMAHKDSDGDVQFYSTIARDISERKAAEEALLRKTVELDELNSELHALTMKITVLEEKERKRLAELLHESIGQNLVAIRLTLKNCFRGLEAIKPEMKDTLEQVISFLDESIRISRTMTADLYSAPLRDKGLRNSIEWYIESVLRPQGINVSLSLDEAVEALTEEIHQVIFSIVRESFQNISKYAGASEVEVSCAESDGKMRLTVRDNGKGFSPEEVKAKRDRGFGLILMREWVKSISGELAICSAPGSGAVIRVEFPAKGTRQGYAR